MELSYCVVNTEGRELLLRCLRAIRADWPSGVEAEVLVLDNGSDDGSADAVRSWNAGQDGLGERLRLIARRDRAGKGENDSIVLREARGELCLLLNEDSELQRGATQALIAALRADPRAAAAGAQLLRPDGGLSACAWRLPGITTALAQALFVHRIFVTQSGKGPQVREVGWVQSAAMLVRRAAAADVGYLDPAFFIYSDETDFCKRLHDAGWRILHVPAARAIHHERLTTDHSPAGRRRMVEFHRNRDLYVRKHHGPLAAALVRWLTAWNYGVRSLVARLRGRDAAFFGLHARLALNPSGPGVREAAAERNRSLAVGEGSASASGGGA